VSAGGTALAAGRRGARWLVTGAGGQLGRSLAALAGELGIEAIGRSRDELDVCDAAAIARALDDVRPDVVLNCAAFTHVDACEEHQEEAARVNATAPGLLAARCRGGALLVHLSTDFVFPGDVRRAIAEDAEPRPLSVYGRTKLDGERAVQASGAEHLIVRTQWLFGPGRNFVRTILDIAGRGEPLRVVRDQVGRPTWTGWLARGVASAVAGGARGVLHLACDGEASWCEFAEAIVDEGSRRGRCPRVRVTPVSAAEFRRPALRPGYGVLALERARSLGIEPPHWRRALHDYLDAEEEKRDA
jgi:dTDP-4-dehydrorhamnose reductase